MRLSFLLTVLVGLTFHSGAQVYAGQSSSLFADIRLEKHSSQTRIAADGTAVTSGRLVLTSLSDQGAKNLQNFRFYPARINETLTVTQASVLSPAPAATTDASAAATPKTTKSIPINSIQDRDWYLDSALQSTLSFLHSKKSPLISFGTLAVGDQVVIDYQVKINRPFFAGVFARTHWTNLQYLEHPDAQEHFFFTDKSLHFQASQPCQTRFTWRPIGPQDQLAEKGFVVKSKAAEPDSVACKWAVSTESNWQTVIQKQQLWSLFSQGAPRDYPLSELVQWNQTLRKLMASNGSQQALFDDSSDLGQRRLKLFERLPFEHRRVVEALGPPAEVSPQALRKTLSKSTAALKHIGNRRPTVDWGRTGVERLDVLLATKAGDPRDFALALTYALNTWGLSAIPGLTFESLNQTDTPLVDLANLTSAVVKVQSKHETLLIDPSLEGGAAGLRSTAHRTYFVEAWGDQQPQWIDLEKLEPTVLKVSQTVEISKELTINTRGMAKVTGSLANDLTDLIARSGTSGIEEHLNTLFGLSNDPKTLKPIVRIGPQSFSEQPDALLGFEFTFSGASLRPSDRLALAKAPFQWYWLKPSLFFFSQPVIEQTAQILKLPVPPYSKLTRDVRIMGRQIADEAQASCFGQNKTTHLMLKSRQAGEDIVMTETLEHRGQVAMGSLTTRSSTSHGPFTEAQSAAFEDHLISRCYDRYAIGIGARPQYENASLGLKPIELSLLTKPLSEIDLSQLSQLRRIGRIEVLKHYIDTKVWLRLESAKEAERQEPIYKLEAALNAIELGKIGSQYTSTEAVRESAKKFKDLPASLSQNADYHRLHSQLLQNSNRIKESAVALQNAMTLEPGKPADLFAMAALALSSGQYAVAEKWLQQIQRPEFKSDATPQDLIRARFEIARLKYQQKNYAGFIAEMDQILAATRKSDTDFQNTLMSYITLLNDANLSDQAVKVLEALEQPSANSQPTPLPEALNSAAGTAYSLKAKSLYAQAVQQPQALALAESYALKAMKLKADHSLNYQIAGDLAFQTALSGDYSALVAAQSYYSKATSVQNETNPQLQANSAWISSRLDLINESLTGSKSLAELMSRKNPPNRLPAKAPDQSPAQMPRKQN